MFSHEPINSVNHFEGDHDSAYKLISKNMLHLNVAYSYLPNYQSTLPTDLPPFLPACLATYLHYMRSVRKFQNVT